MDDLARPKVVVPSAPTADPTVARPPRAPAFSSVRRESNRDSFIGNALVAHSPGVVAVRSSSLSPSSGSGGRLTTATIGRHDLPSTSIVFGSLLGAVGRAQRLPGVAMPVRPV